MKIQHSMLLNKRSFKDTLLCSTSIALLMMVLISPLLIAGCSKTNHPAIPVDYNNPESVLRAYFKAWEQGEWSFQVSLMDEKYAQMVPEPVESIHILEFQAITNTLPSEHTYQVDFEIKVKGNGISMQSGEYSWTYYLSWDDKRASWIITNYGAG